jgi:hypothetical protein
MLLQADQPIRLQYSISHQIKLIFIQTTPIYMYMELYKEYISVYKWYILLNYVYDPMFYFLEGQSSYTINANIFWRSNHLIQLMPITN